MWNYTSTKSKYQVFIIQTHGKDFQKVFQVEAEAKNPSIRSPLASTPHVQSVLRNRNMKRQPLKNSQWRWKGRWSPKYQRVELSSISIR